jgi:hypothetical protein
MKTFKITCIRTKKILAVNSPDVVYLTEQIYETDAPVLNFTVSDGYAIISICEILPPVKDEISKG